MKVSTLLQERLVNSSWLKDVSYYGRRNRFFPGEEIITFKVQKNPKKQKGAKLTANRK